MNWWLQDTQARWFTCTPARSCASKVTTRNLSSLRRRRCRLLLATSHSIHHGGGGGGGGARRLEEAPALASLRGLSRTIYSSIQLTSFAPMLPRLWRLEFQCVRCCGAGANRQPSSRCRHREATALRARCQAFKLLLPTCLLASASMVKPFKV